MKAFAWQESKFVSGGIVKIISTDGILVTAFEPRTTWTKLKEIIGKFAPNYEVEFLDRPWSNEEFKHAMKLYELNWGVRFDCRNYE